MNQYGSVSQWLVSSFSYDSIFTLVWMFSVLSSVCAYNKISHSTFVIYEGWPMAEWRERRKTRPLKESNHWSFLLLSLPQWIEQIPFKLKCLKLVNKVHLNHEFFMFFNYPDFPNLSLGNLILNTISFLLLHETFDSTAYGGFLVRDVLGVTKT